MVLCFFAGGCLFWSGWARRKGKEKSFKPSLPGRPSKFQIHREKKRGTGGEGAEILPAPPLLAEKPGELCSELL